MMEICCYLVCSFFILHQVFGQPPFFQSQPDYWLNFEFDEDNYLLESPQFTCKEVNSSEALNYTWFHVDQPERILSDQKTYIATDANLDDCFYCIARNRFGAVRSKNACFKLVEASIVVLNNCIYVYLNHQDMKSVNTLLQNILTTTELMEYCWTSHKTKQTVCGKIPFQCFTDENPQNFNVTIAWYSSPNSDFRKNVTYSASKAEDIGESPDEVYLIYHVSADNIRNLFESTNSTISNLTVHCLTNKKAVRFKYNLESTDLEKNSKSKYFTIFHVPALKSRLITCLNKRGDALAERIVDYRRTVEQNTEFLTDPKLSQYFNCRSNRLVKWFYNTKPIIKGDPSFDINFNALKINRPLSGVYQCIALGNDIIRSLVIVTTLSAELLEDGMVIDASNIDFISLHFRLKLENTVLIDKKEINCTVRQIYPRELRNAFENVFVFKNRTESTDYNYLTYRMKLLSNLSMSLIFPKTVSLRGMINCSYRKRETTLFFNLNVTNSANEILSLFNESYKSKEEIFLSSKKLKKLTEDPTYLSPNNLHLTANLLGKLLANASSDIEQMRIFLQSLENMASISEEDLKLSQDRHNTAKKMLDLIDKILGNLQPGQSIVEKSIILAKFAVDKTVNSSVNSTVTFDPTSFNHSSNMKIAIRTEAISGSDVSFKFMTSDILMRAQNLKNQPTSSPIISASTKLNQNEVTDNTIIIDFEDEKPIRLSENGKQCVYWSTEMNQWCSAGCRSIRLSPSLTRCECNHLTNFALLMRLECEESVNVRHDYNLMIITRAALLISILSLAIFCVVYTLHYRKSKKSGSKAQVIFKNIKNQFTTLLSFAATLFIANISFLAAGNYPNDDLLCKCIGALLHYLYLSVIMWSLVESGRLYFTIVRLYTNQSTMLLYIPRYCMISSCTAWIVPAIMVSVCAAINIDNYGFENCNSKPNCEPIRAPGLCYLKQNAFYWFFLIPTALILIMNFIVFIMLFWIVIQAKRSQLQRRESIGSHSYKQASQSTLSLIGIFSVFSLSWLFGILQFSYAKFVFQYIFVVTTSLQGFFLFLFYCLIKPELRRILTGCGLIFTKRCRQTDGALTLSSKPKTTETKESTESCRRTFPNSSENCVQE